MSDVYSARLTDAQTRYLELTDTDFTPFVHEQLNNTIGTETTGLCPVCANPTFSDKVTLSPDHDDHDDPLIRDVICSDCAMQPKTGVHNKTRLKEAFEHNDIHRKWSDDLAHITTTTDALDIYHIEHEIASSTDIQYTHTDTDTPTTNDNATDPAKPRVLEEYGRAWHVFDYLIQTGTPVKNTAYGLPESERNTLQRVIEWLAAIEADLPPLLEQTTGIDVDMVTGESVSPTTLTSLGARVLPDSCITEPTGDVMQERIAAILQHTVILPMLENGELHVTVPHPDTAGTDPDEDLTIGTGTLLNALPNGIDGIYRSIREVTDEYQKARQSALEANAWYDHNQDTVPVTELFDYDCRFAFLPAHIAAITAFRTHLETTVETPHRDADTLPGVDEDEANRTSLVSDAVSSLQNVTARDFSDVSLLDEVTVAGDVIDVRTVNIAVQCGVDDCETILISPNGVDAESHNQCPLHPDAEIDVAFVGVFELETPDGYTVHLDIRDTDFITEVTGVSEDTYRENAREQGAVTAAERLSFSVAQPNVVVSGQVTHITDSMIVLSAPPNQVGV